MQFTSILHIDKTRNIPILKDFKIKNEISVGKK